MKTKDLEIKGVKIGDLFTKGNIKCKVVDFFQIISLSTGKVVEYKCIAQSLTMSSNLFEVPFATIIRFKLSRP